MDAVIGRQGLSEELWHLPLHQIQGDSGVAGGRQQLQRDTEALQRNHLQVVGHDEGATR